MRRWADHARRNAKRTAAAVLIVALYVAARPPSLAPSERVELARRFHFAETELDAFADRRHDHIRPVSPGLAHIDAWISALGAAIAFNDLDGDGLANDVGYVETTSNSVIVCPAPGTGARYAPFTLEPTRLAYDGATMAPMGCVPGDLNEDGRMDVVVYYWGRTPIAFLCNADMGAGAALRLSRESYVERELLTTNERWFTNALTLADVDGDGHFDIVIGNYFPDGARVLDVASSEPDCMQVSMSRAFNGGKNRVLRWSGARGGNAPDVTFEPCELGIEAPYDTQWTLAAGAADLDGDLLPEIYFANDFGPDQLLHNRSKPGSIAFARTHGRGRFDSPHSKVVGSDSFKGMGVDFADVDGDGALDIHVSNITTEFGLEESNLLFRGTGDATALARGVAPFEERSERYGLARSGWAWDVRFGDFDNDGVLEVLHTTGFLRGEVNRWPELHEAAMGNDELLADPRFWHRFGVGDDLSGHQHGPFFVRASDGRYWDLASDIGLGRTTVSRAIATADVDGDGDLDFAIGSQWEPSHFYRNDAPAAGAFLTLHLRFALVDADGNGVRVEHGTPQAGELGRAAIGATARIELPNGRHAIEFVDGGNGHSGKRSSELHFGLGATATDAAIKVELTWRSPHGERKSSVVTLTPGWHTLWLGASDARGSTR